MSDDDTTQIVCVSISGNIVGKLDALARTEQRSRSNLVSKILTDYFKE